MSHCRNHSTGASDGMQIQQEHAKNQLILEKRAKMAQTPTNKEKTVQPPMVVTDRHLQQWQNIAFEIYLALTDSHGAFNTVVCVPQILATLELFAQAANLNCRSYIRQLIFPESSTALLYNGSLSHYIESWENAAHEAARPGSFRTQRRFFVHPNYTKSYGFETFMTLKSLGTEVKILYHGHTKEILDWLRRACKIDNIPDCLDPINVWPAEKKYAQTVNNQKCPIFVAVSHFEFPIKSNVLDCEKVYYINFTPSVGRPTRSLACRLMWSALNPFRSVKIGGPSSIIALPTSCDNLSLYLIDYCDALDIKNGEQLKDLISLMENAQVNKTMTNLFLPLFFDFPDKSTNIGQALSSSVKEMDKLFQPDAFGDLAYDGSEPSAVGSHRTAANIQHYDYLELMRLPDLNCVVNSPVASEQNYIISHPFMVIIWDNSKKMPLYIVRVGLPDGPRQDDNELRENKSSSRRFLWKLKRNKTSNRQKTSKRNTLPTEETPMTKSKTIQDPLT